MKRILLLCLFLISNFFGFAQADIKVLNTNFQTKYVGGTEVTYTITVINLGPTAAANVNVSSLISNGISQKEWTGPASIVNNNAVNSNGSGEINHTIGVLTNNQTAGTLNSGQMVSYIMKIKVPLGFTGNLVCRVTATSTTTDPNPANNEAIDTDTKGIDADVSITNTNNQVIYTPNSTTTYIVKVKNNGPKSAGGVVVSNTIPLGITNYSWTGTNGSSGTNVPLNNTIGALFAGQTITYTITAQIPAGFVGDLTNTVDVTSASTDNTTANNTATDTDVVNSGADLVVVNTDGTATYVTGTQNVYTVTVTNNGPNAATNVVVNNAIPAGITSFSWTGSNGSSGTNTPLNDTLPTLANGASVTYTITIDIPSNFTGNLVSEANATSDTVDLFPNCSQCIDINTFKSVADVIITNTNNQITYIQGGTSVYTVTVTNEGPQSATNVLVNNPIPAGITDFTWSGNGANGTNTNLTNTILNLGPGESVVYTITMQIPLTFTGNLTSTATASILVSDNDPTNNTSTDTDTLGAGADIVVTNTDNQTYYTTGANSVYTITVTNNGPVDAVNVTVNNPIPSGVTTSSWTGSNGTSGTNANLVDAIPLLAVGSSVVYTFTMQIPATQTTDFVSTVTATSTTPDPNPNCVACADTDLSPANMADIVTTISDNSPNYKAGEPRTYTVTITNNGPSDAQNVVVQGNVSSAIDPTTILWSGNGNGVTVGYLNTTIPTLANGASVTYTVYVPVPSNYSQTQNLVSSVVVTSDTMDPNPNCIACTDTDTPKPNADIVVYKTNNQTQFLLDDTTTYVITVRNDGVSDAINVAVNDGVPNGINASNMSWISSTGASGTGAVNEVIPVLEAGGVVIYKVSVKVNAFFSSVTGNLVNVVNVTSGTADFDINNNNSSDVDTPRPKYVTVDSQSYAATIDGVTGPERLIKNILINEPCVQLSNFSASAPVSFGYFHRNNSDFPFKEGIIIRSGIAAYTSGSYVNSDDPPFDHSTTGSGVGDADLSAILAAAGLNSNTFDASYVKFDFVPTVEDFKFNFIFASQEYSGFQCSSSFVDGFAFILTNLVTGEVQNLAVVPGTNTLISVVKIRKQIYNASCGDLNPQYFGRYNTANVGPQPVGPVGSSINLGGQTVSMVAEATVIPNNPYQIKLVIADVGDGILDSAVFLEAGSFNIGGPKITGTGVYLTTNDFSGPNAFCAGTPRIIQAGTASNPNVTYSWRKDDVLIPDATGYQLEVTESGIYTVIFTYGANGCQQSDDVIVEFKPTDYPMEDADDLYVCTPTFDLTLNEPVVMANYDETEFETFYYTTLEAAQDPVGTPIPAAEVTAFTGTTGQEIWMKMVNNFGGGICDPIESFKLYPITPPSGTFSYAEDGGPAGFCTGSNSILMPVAPDFPVGGTYTATPAGLTIDLDTGAIDLSTSLVGTYTITYDFSGQGCVYTTDIQLEVIFCGATVASNSGNVCEGEATFDLFASDAGIGATYEWKDYNNVAFSTDQNPVGVTVPTAPGSYNYSVVATINGIPSDVSTTTLVVHPTPTASFTTASSTICTNAQLTIFIEGTPNAIVNVTDENSNISTVVLDGNGIGSFTTNPLLVETTFTLVEAIGPTTPPCPANLTGSITISVGLPTATIVGFIDPVICSGEETFLQIQGTPNATVSYTIGGVAQADVILGNDGTFPIPTGIQTAGTFTYALTNVESNPAPPALSCSDVITGQSATLTVNALPTASFTVVAATICEGDTATLNFTGTPNATVSYSNGSQTLTTILNATGTKAVTTAALLVDTTFTLVSVEVTDSNNVTCSNTLTGTLTVTMNDNVTITSPVVDYEVTICPGASQTFTTAATGDGLTYQWYFNGTTLLPSTTNSYTVSNATAANTGDYTVIVSDGCGNQETSAIATLTVSQATVITSEPAPTPQTVCEGTAISIAIAATGTNLTYQWFRGTTPVSGATATTPTLTINSTVVADSGDYTCHITSGACGTIISNIAKLTVNQAPAILAQTGGGAICVGETANFSVTATGTNLTYQWYKGTGELIVNETSNTYSIPNATEADSNTYYCTISSTSCAPINTTPVTLTVKPLPTATISQGNPSTICEGESTQVIFNGTPLAVVIYTINGGTPETITLDVNGGDTILPTGTLTETTVYELVSVTYTGVDACSQNLTGSATVTVNPLPTVSLEDGFICIDPVTLAVTRTYTLETGLNEAEFTFEWFDENGVIANQSNSFYEASAVGQYGVTITDIITGCQASAFADVDSSSPPTDFTYTVNGFFADNPTVVITATPIGQYEYQLDYGPFQESNVFDNIEAGPHTITVRDPEACDVLTKDVLIIDYPKYFTPNGDGINDTWNIPEINTVSMTKIYIFDRFGKLIKEMTASGSGWDGTYNGQELPATDYWFTINYQEVGINKEFRAHFSLKR